MEQPGQAKQPAASEGIELRAFNKLSIIQRGKEQPARAHFGKKQDPNELLSAARKQHRGGVVDALTNLLPQGLRKGPRSGALKGGDDDDDLAPAEVADEVEALISRVKSWTAPGLGAAGLGPHGATALSGDMLLEMALEGDDPHGGYGSAGAAALANRVGRKVTASQQREQERAARRQPLYPGAPSRSQSSNLATVGAGPGEKEKGAGKAPRTSGSGMGPGGGGGGGSSGAASSAAAAVAGLRTASMTSTTGMRPNKSTEGLAQLAGGQAAAATLGSGGMGTREGPALSSRGSYGAAPGTAGGMGTGAGALGATQGARLTSSLSHFLSSLGPGGVGMAGAGAGAAGKAPTSGGSVGGGGGGTTPKLPALVQARPGTKRALPLELGPPCFEGGGSAVEEESWLSGAGGTLLSAAALGFADALSPRAGGGYSSAGPSSGGSHSGRSGLSGTQPTISAALALATSAAARHSATSLPDLSTTAGGYASHKLSNYRPPGASNATGGGVGSALAPAPPPGPARASHRSLGPELGGGNSLAHSLSSSLSVGAPAGTASVDHRGGGAGAGAGAPRTNIARALAAIRSDSSSPAAAPGGGGGGPTSGGGGGGLVGREGSVTGATGHASSSAYRLRRPSHKTLGAMSGGRASGTGDASDGEGAGWGGPGGRSRERTPRTSVTGLQPAQGQGQGGAVGSSSGRNFQELLAVIKGASDSLPAATLERRSLTGSLSSERLLSRATSGNSNK